MCDNMTFLTCCPPYVAPLRPCPASKPWSGQVELPVGQTWPRLNHHSSPATRSQHCITLDHTLLPGYTSHVCMILSLPCFCSPKQYNQSLFPKAVQCSTIIHCFPRQIANAWCSWQLAAVSLQGIGWQHHGQNYRNKLHGQGAIIGISAAAKQQQRWSSNPA